MNEGKIAIMEVWIKIAKIEAVRIRSILRNHWRAREQEFNNNNYSTIWRGERGARSKSAREGAKLKCKYV